MDHLRATVSLTRSGSRLDVELDTAISRRRLEHLVLSREDFLAASTRFHLSAVEDRPVAMGRLCSAGRGSHRFIAFVVEEEWSPAPGLFRHDLFCRFAFSGAWIFQRLLFHILIRERSLPISRLHGPAGADRQYGLELFS